MPGDRLAGRRVSDARLLSEERWIGFPATRGERGPGQALAYERARAGLHHVEVTLMDNHTAQKRLAQAGFGLALVPESSVRARVRSGALVVLTIRSMPTTIPITAIHRPNGCLNSAVKALMALLTKDACNHSRARGQCPGGR